MSKMVAGATENFNNAIERLPEMLEQSFVCSMCTLFPGPPSFQGTNHFRSGSTIAGGSTTGGTSTFGASSSYSSTGSKFLTDSRSPSAPPVGYGTFQLQGYPPGFPNFSGNSPSSGVSPSNSRLGGSSEEHFGGLSMSATSGLSYPDLQARPTMEGSSMDVYNSAAASSAQFSPDLSLVQDEMGPNFLEIYTNGGGA